MTSASEATVDAGEFGAWLRETRAALDDDRPTQVPCGSCTGCCTSTYFITLRPQDAAAKRRIPIELRVEAPSLPPGHELLGYDAQGRCHMLRDGACGIYEDRPQTCRTYDCRVLAAAGLSDAGGPLKAAITERVRRWRFSYADETARRAHAAVRAAATFIRNDATSFPPGTAPSRPNDVAVAAVRSYELFLDGEVPESRDAKAALAARVRDRWIDRRESAARQGET